MSNLVLKLTYLAKASKREIKLCFPFITADEREEHLRGARAVFGEPDRIDICDVSKTQGSEKPEEKGDHLHGNT